MTPVEYIVCSLGWLLGAPWPNEAFAFPPRSEVLHALSINRTYREYLLDYAQWYPGYAHDAQRARIEAVRLFDVWDELDTAQSGLQAPQRQAALWRLRAMIGERMYYCREMPYPIPLRYVTVVGR